MLERIMPFGKHRGKPIQELPGGSLFWYLENLDLSDRPGVAEAMLAELKQRLQSFAADTPAAVPDFADQIRQWYRQLAWDYHPDRGGSAEAMRVVNDAHERLHRHLAAGA